MGRRSDHTRQELQALLLDEGARQLAAVGLAKFSARDVAKRVGYSIGTLYNVFGSYDGLVLALNARTLAAWRDELAARLAAAAGGERIAALVGGYFAFAAANPNAWIAIFEHHMVGGGPSPAWYQDVVAEVMGLVVGELAAALPASDAVRVEALARSLVATVHGHCMFALLRTFNALGETDPQAAALARVREALAAAQATPP
jgi:AcrR family transcriptional regulator